MDQFTARIHKNAGMTFYVVDDGEYFVASSESKDEAVAEMELFIEAAKLALDALKQLDQSR